MKELSDFAELQKEFSDQITVIAIDRQEPLEKAKGYTDELGITDDSVISLIHQILSINQLVASLCRTILVNSAGEIIVHKRGPMELEEMREHVNKIIE